ncbi:MAG TPA: EsaB/YukD family protein [Candidatus Dormibacteraeota bacterium]|nr:EsaB/YukD family protein [Candidatus Dormibacteraeota bacterium]
MDEGQTALTVTVVSPMGHHRLSVPARAPLRAILADLVNSVGMDGGGPGAPGWVLAHENGDPLPLERSLLELAVPAETVLQLTPPAGDLPAAEPAPAPAPDLPAAEPEAAPAPEPTTGPRRPTADHLGPIERTARALPRRVNVPARVMATTAALLRAPRATPVAPRSGDRPPPPAMPAPAALTVERRASRLTVARARWRSLDYLDQLDTAIAGPRLTRCATIALVSPKGGVGKTPLTALLGTLLSLLRRDHVVALDANPDFGSLGRVLTPEQHWYVDDLLELVDGPDLSLVALDSHLGRAIHGLLVVSAPADPVRMARLNETAYLRVIARLKEFFGVVLLDCGTGLQEPAARAAIAASDQVVLITDAEPATASLVAEAAQLLRTSGRPITVAVNKMPKRGARLDLHRLSSHLADARGLVVIPHHPAAAAQLASGSFNWRDAPQAWQESMRELAVALLADWGPLGLIP